MKKWRIKFKITNQLNASKKSQVMLGYFRRNPLIVKNENNSWFFEIIITGGDHTKFLSNIVQEIESLLDIVSFQIMSEIIILEIQVYNISEIFKQNESQEIIPVTLDEIKDIKKIPEKKYMQTY